METRFTPGPWVVRHHPADADMFFVEAEGNPEMPYRLDICGEDYTGHGDEPQRLANMRLISAAPELYEALSGFERAHDLWLPSKVSDEHIGEAEALHQLRQKMLSALAKARGETNE